MDSPVWRRIKRFVETGRETPKVDFKRTLSLSDRSKKAEFVKDVTAIANTPGGDGFLIIGVLDSDCRSGEGAGNYVLGFESPNGPDEFQRQMYDALNYFCDRVPEIEYSEIRHPESGRTIGVVTIKCSLLRPHTMIRESGEIKQHDVFIRRGSATFRATPQEIIEMSKKDSLPVVTLINFSSHVLTPEQKMQIEEKVYVEEYIEYDVHFDAKGDLEHQVKEFLEKTGLTLEEWSTKDICLLLPGLAPGAAALLAYIHGLRGGFPRVAWIYQDSKEGGSSPYKLAQLIKLQDLRDNARKNARVKK